MVNRIHKVLEDANIKLATVATDIMGVSGRAMLRAMCRALSAVSTFARRGPASLSRE